MVRYLMVGLSNVTKGYAAFEHYARTVSVHGRDIAVAWLLTLVVGLSGIVTYCLLGRHDIKR